MSEPWFRMHASIGSKRVVWRLMEWAKIPKARAVGHLAMFWGAVSQHCPGGRIADVPDAEIEEWAGWDGRRGVFARFVREQHSADGVVNDYSEYSGVLDARREKDRARQAAYRAARATSHDASPSAESPRHADVTRDTARDVTPTDDVTSGVTSALAPGVTIRDDTRRDITTPPTLSRRAKRAGETDGAIEREFGEVWAAYPRRAGGSGRADAMAAYVARRREGVSHAEIMAGVSRYAQYCEATGKVGTEYVKQARTFLGRGRHYEERWEIMPASTNGTAARGGRSRPPSEITKQIIADMARQETTSDA